MENCRYVWFSSISAPGILAAPVPYPSAPWQAAVHTFLEETAGARMGKKDPVFQTLGICALIAVSDHHATKRR